MSPGRESGGRRLHPPVPRGGRPAYGPPHRPAQSGRGGGRAEHLPRNGAKMDNAPIGCSSCGSPHRARPRFEVRTRRPQRRDARRPACEGPLGAAPVDGRTGGRATRRDGRRPARRAVRARGRDRTPTSRAACAAVVVVTLRAHKARQAAERLAAGRQDGGYVFTTSVGRPLDSPNATQDFQQALVRLGLPRWYSPESRGSRNDAGGPLSCVKRWSGRSDSNARPPEPHSGALPGCATPRQAGESTRGRGHPRRPGSSRQDRRASTH